MAKREVIELSSDSEHEMESKRAHIDVAHIDSDTNGVPNTVQKTPAQVRRELMAAAIEKRTKHPGLLKEMVNTASKSDAGKVPLQTIASSKKSQTNSRIKLLGNPGYGKLYHQNTNSEKDTLLMEDLIGSKNLIETFQFNFLIDMTFLTSFIKSDNCKFTVITQAQSDYLSIPDQLWERFQIHSIDASKNLKKYGSHHTKMMVNFFDDDSCQLVIHTMNLTQADYLIQTQMAWVSPRLKMDLSKKKDIKKEDFDIKVDTGVLFKKDLFFYLAKYNEPEINALIDKLSVYDFDPIDVIFVGSCPGEYKIQDKEALKDPSLSNSVFGFGRLWQVIQQNNLESLDGTFVSQMSAISGPFDSYQRNIFIHLLTSCVENGYPFAKKADYKFKRGQGKVEPVIIWPTIEEILGNLGGAQSGRALFYTTKGKWPAYSRQAAIIRNYLYKWSNGTETRAGRSHLSPHLKSYALTEDQFKSLKWFLLTSANLSHQAWGKPFKFDPNNKSVLHYEISSYEAGVMLVPDRLKIDNKGSKKVKLVPTFGQDSVPASDSDTSANYIKAAVRLPYDLPLEKYKSSDQPWARPDVETYIMESL